LINACNVEAVYIYILCSMKSMFMFQLQFRSSFLDHCIVVALPR
jgi:hypothetical protein